MVASLIPGILPLFYIQVTCEDSLANGYRLGEKETRAGLHMARTFENVTLCIDN